MAVQRFRLTVVDRTIIELRRRDGCSIRMIARELGRSSGTVCDEINRHGKVTGYRAATALHVASVVTPTKARPREPAACRYVVAW